MRTASGAGFMQPDATILALKTLQGIVDSREGGVSVGTVAEAAMPHIAAILTGTAAGMDKCKGDVQLYAPAMTVWPSSAALGEAHLQAQSEAFAVDEEKFLAKVAAEHEANAAKEGEIENSQNTEEVAVEDFLQEDQKKEEEENVVVEDFLEETTGEAAAEEATAEEVPSFIHSFIHLLFHLTHLNHSLRMRRRS